MLDIPVNESKLDFNLFSGLLLNKAQLAEKHPNLYRK